MKVIIEQKDGSSDRKVELSEYIKDKIIDQYSFDYDDTDKLEAIAYAQAGVTSRLIEILVEKNLITLDDSYYISSGYNASASEYLRAEN